MSENGNAASTAQAAAKTAKPKTMLTDMEKLIYDRCEETGQTPGEALEFDLILHQRITDKVTAVCRPGEILDRLERSPKYLKQQIAKLKAGVREPKDEPRHDSPWPLADHELAIRRGLDEQEESRVVDA